MGWSGERDGCPLHGHATDRRKATAGCTCKRHQKTGLWEMAVNLFENGYYPSIGGPTTGPPAGYMFMFHREMTDDEKAENPDRSRDWIIDCVPSPLAETFEAAVLQATKRLRGMNHDDAKRGLYRKFIVSRTDKRDGPGEKHHDCCYFVLDLDHDPHALKALRAYAVACESTEPNLSLELRATLESQHHADRFQDFMDSDEERGSK